MKSKEKKRILIGVVLVVILIMIYIIYNIQMNKLIVYASNNKPANDVVKISNAEKVDIEKIISDNQEGKAEQIITEEIDLEYITEYRTNKELPKGTMKVIQEGRIGTEQVTLKITYNENNERQEELINSVITKAAVDKIVEIGTSNIKINNKITLKSNIYVTSDRADIMKESNIDSGKVTTISRNTEMTVYAIDGDWYKVVANGQVGWIKSENVAIKNPEPIVQNNQSNGITKCDFNMALNKPSGLTLEQFKKVLTDSKDVNNVFSENAEYFYYIEQQYGINGIFVAAIGIHESAWGTSRISLNKKNLFGYGAYDSSPYSSSYNYNSYSEGIDLLARVLMKHYLNPKGTVIYGGEIATGKYYNGNTLTGVNQKYASDKNWANKVYSYMEYLYKKI